MLKKHLNFNLNVCGKNFVLLFDQISLIAEKYGIFANNNKLLDEFRNRFFVDTPEFITDIYLN